MIDAILQSLPLALVAAVPLLLAVEGEVVVQRSGIINLGIEGMETSDWAPCATELMRMRLPVPPSFVIRSADLLPSRKPKPNV